MAVALPVVQQQQQSIISWIFYKVGGCQEKLGGTK